MIYVDLVLNPRSSVCASYALKNCFKIAWGPGVDRHEPIFQLYRETTKYQSCREKYEQVGWVPFLENFKGHHEGVSLSFVQTYDGESVQFGDMKLTILKATIAEATGLPSAREILQEGDC
jgi:hypothetical protein